MYNFNTSIILYLEVNGKWGRIFPFATNPIL